MRMYEYIVDVLITLFGVDELDVVAYLWPVVEEI